jgi:enamine deaminase RidA (YjgF/YER057c/UK114 family)
MKRKAFDVQGSSFPDWYPSSSGVQAGPFVFTASHSATDWDGGLVDRATVNPQLPYVSGHPVKRQVREVYRRLAATLAAGGATLESGVSINQWQPTYHGPVLRHEALRDPYPLFWEDWRSVAHAYIQSRDEFLLSDRPASCLMPVDRLVNASADIEVQMTALTLDSGVTKRAYQHDVHSPLGGYSVGVEAGPWLYSAGFIATDFKTGLHPNAQVPEHIWYGNQVAGEVAETLRQIRVTMEASGASWNSVAKVVMYLTPRGIVNLPAVDEVFAANWPDSPPARAVIPVSGIGGVKGGNVEIYVIVGRPEGGGDREAVHTHKALPALGYEAQAVRCGPFLFLSTQFGRAADGPALSTERLRRSFPQAGAHIADQVYRLQENVQTICEAAGTSIENTVKADLYLSDLHDLAPTLAAWKGAFTDGYPASGFFETPPHSLIVPGCDVAADLVIYIPE